MNFHSQEIIFYFGSNPFTLFFKGGSNPLNPPGSASDKSGHSTETTLLSIKTYIYLSLSRGEATALVLLDLSAAFDMIDRSTLRGCLLDWYGVGGSALKWFSPYLTECYQSVKIGSALSDLQKHCSAYLRVLFWVLFYSICIHLPLVH